VKRGGILVSKGLAQKRVMVNARVIEGDPGSVEAASNLTCVMRLAKADANIEYGAYLAAQARPDRVGLPRLPPFEPDSEPLDERNLVRRSRQDQSEPVSAPKRDYPVRPKRVIDERAPPSDSGDAGLVKR
jgi:hypothetical protein